MMEQTELLDHFIKFGLAGVLGWLIGLERSMGEEENPHATLRDFILFALLGAASAFAAQKFGSAWFAVAGFLGFLALLLSGYWADLRRDPKSDLGITTEGAAILTFVLGVMCTLGAEELAIAVGIAVLGLLAYKSVLDQFSQRLQAFELIATFKFLAITFIVLPILPNDPLDTFFTTKAGTVTAVDAQAKTVTLQPDPEIYLERGQSENIYLDDGTILGRLEFTEVDEKVARGTFQNKAFEAVTEGAVFNVPILPSVGMVLLSALKPFKIWLIVVLVSFISFIGYILMKLLGSSAGIGLTGLVGGLASSTVTTLSFAKRSLESPGLSPLFAVAVLLASSVMFPRLLLQIGVFNQKLAGNIALPILVTGGVGVALSVLFFVRSGRKDPVEGEEAKLDNPFSLSGAVKFGLVFATILMVTRLAIEYLGNAWLPVVAIVSGLTDADAIAFSLSDAQRAGLISLDWASFNLVLGALSNTFMKLFLVLGLGHRTLFKHLLVSFLIMGAVGIVTMLLYYDLGGMWPA